MHHSLRAAVAAAVATAIARAQGFNPAAVQVLRAGTIGGGTLRSAATPMFIDQYAVTGGAATATWALPTTAAGTALPCTQSGSASTDGLGSVGVDGVTIVFGCYGAASGVASGALEQRGARFPLFLALP